MTVSRLGMTVMAALITVVGASLPAAAFAQWWNPLAPKTYDECILKNMKGVTSDRAADMVTLSCMQQFDTQDEKWRAAFIDGRCHFTWNGYRFHPKAQKPGYGFEGYKVEYGESMPFYMWIPDELSRSWGEEKAAREQRFRALVSPHTDFLLRECDNMMVAAGG